MRVAATLQRPATDTTRRDLAMPAKATPLCLVCGIETERTSGVGRPRTRCIKCQETYRRERRWAPPKACRVCGAMFQGAGKDCLAHRKDRSAKASPVACCDCLETFIARDPARQRRCPACQKAFKRRVPRVRTEKSYRTSQCVICHTPFRHRQAREQATCSRECGRILVGQWALALRVMAGPTSVEIMCPLNWRTCERCGVEWLARMGATPMYCGQACRSNYQPKPRQATCSICGLTFTGNRNAKFCSTSCMRKGPGYKANSTIQKLKRERRLKSVVVERFTSEEIFERDGHRCQLCLRKLEMGKTVPHPLAPTIDHIVPLADGGPHTRANVQAAHFKCNSLRGNRGAAQLRLA